MSLKNTAKETLEIVKAGQYTNSSEKVVDFAVEQKAAEANTKLYTPEELANISDRFSVDVDKDNKLTIEVTNETTQLAAYRLVAQENCSDLVLLNFASAKNPGGGFLNRAKAQEEDLARCSGLYPCLQTQPTYYKVNRAYESLLYTDHIIYSPKVPWFKTRSTGQLLADFFLASVITAPAPNAGEVLRRDPTAKKDIAIALYRRAKYVLTVARDNGHRSLLLGAWGCGVFRNDPYTVANAFGIWLHSPEFADCFDRVVFAIYDPTKEKRIFNAFRSRLKYHRCVFKLLQEELKRNNPPLLPWLRCPKLSRYSLGWRMGFGEDYMFAWDIWSDFQSKKDLLEYFKGFAPISCEWADWVAYRLYGDDFDNYQEYKNDQKTRVKKLEQIGLANYREWEDWYSSQWKQKEQ